MLIYEHYILKILDKMPIRCYIISGLLNKVTEF